MACLPNLGAIDPNMAALGEFRVEHKLRSYLTITGTAQSEKERYGLGLGIKKDF